MKKLIKILLSIPNDKLLHFIVSQDVTLFIASVLIAFNIKVIVVSALAFIITFVIGYIKEYYDSKHGGVFDLFDLIADTLGAFIALIVILMLAL